VQRIQVWRKQRLEQHLGVSNILTLKAKAHFFGVGMVVHGSVALWPSPRGWWWQSVHMPGAVIALGAAAAAAPQCGGF
jgi:hypothetical protein